MVGVLALLWLIPLGLCWCKFFMCMHMYVKIALG